MASEVQGNGKDGWHLRMSAHEVLLKLYSLKCISSKHIKFAEWHVFDGSIDCSN